MSRRRTYRPRVSPDREYEALVHEYRLDFNLTIRELSERSGVHQNHIVALANGTMAPVTKDGRLRKPALRLCEFFDAEPYDLFPRYACDIRRALPFPDGLFTADASKRMARDPEAILIHADLLRKAFAEAGGSRIEKKFLAACLMLDSYDNVAAALGYSRTHVSNVMSALLGRMKQAAEKLNGKEAGSAKPPKPPADELLVRQIRESAAWREIEHEIILEMAEKNRGDISQGDQEKLDDLDGKIAKSIAQRSALLMLLSTARANPEKLVREEVDAVLARYRLPPIAQIHEALKRRAAWRAQMKRPEEIPPAKPDERRR